MNTHVKIHMKGLRNPWFNRSAAALVCSFAMMVPLKGVSGEEIDRTLEMPADGLVLVENLAGSVEIVTWDRAEAQIRGEAGDDVEEVEILSTAKGIQIMVRNRKGKRRIDGTDLHLRIPESASIEADTVSADITVSDSSGETITLRTVSGDLEVEADSNRIELRSVSGDIEFEGSADRSTVETVSGDITLAGVKGEVSANAVSGDISLEAGELVRGSFESVSGDMTLELSVADDGRLGCDSMSGDVMLRLPDSQEAGFTAQTYSGSIHTDFGKSATISKGPGVVLDYRAGDNGAKIRLETFSGDITIRSD